jgi:hypothetical protein
MRMLHKYIIIAALSGVLPLAFAELSLTIEDLIADKGKVSLGGIRAIFH